MPYYVKRGLLEKVAVLLALSAAAVLVPSIAAQMRKKSAPKAAAEPSVRPEDTFPPGWAIKFDEEFNSSSIDYRKWSPHAPGKVDLEGQQTWIPAAIQISGGQAHLTARKTPSGYTCGILTTLGSFAQKFGRFEIRFRMPAGAGLEPLLRLLPLTAGDQPSIDVMHAEGDNPGRALFANRWLETNLDRNYSGSWDGADLSGGFHTIAAEWDPEKIVWFVDGVERFVSWDGIPQEPLYLAVCLEVHDPNAQTHFPATLDIDYIRVFSRP
ncbi:MAG TPA: glycoside hydrolase family 16 protein [Bryobacteraceae bacterium]|nr:glycoside hydrolase family 16 protein [Bryobacteraceae bacterium]